MQTIKSALTKILTDQNFFVWIVGAIIFTFWLTGIWTIGLVVLCLILAAVFAFSKDTSRVLAILFMFVFIISSDRHNLGGFSWVLYVSIGLLIAGIITHIIRFKPSFKPIFQERKVKGFSLSLLFLCIPAALGGIARQGQRNIVAVLAAFGFFLLVALCYLFFLATTEQKKGDDMLKYVLVIMLVSGIVISLQMMVFYVRLGSIDAVMQSITKKDMRLGWAGNNNVAPMLALTLPSTFYFATKKKNYGFIFIVLAFIQYALIFSTRCRGAILFTTLAFPFMLCYTMAKSKNKTANGIAISLCVCAVFLLVVLKGEEFLLAFERMFKLGLDHNGRMPLYNEAIGVFKQFPIFGAGWDYQLGEMAGDGYTPYWYHSTPLQILANMGIVGMLFYIPLFFWRYASSLLTKNYRTAKLAVGAGMVLFELYGLVDVNFFGPTFFICMVIMSFAVEKSLQSHQCNPVIYTKLLNKSLKAKKSR